MNETISTNSLNLRMKRENARLCPFVLLISFCVFFLELIYPKMLQAASFFENVLLIMLIAMAGIGGGGVLAFYIKEKEKAVTYLLVSLPLVIMASYFVIAFRFHMYVVAALLFAVFLIYGAVIAVSFIYYNSNKVYFYNLCGFGCGAIFSSLILGLLGGEGCVIFACILSAIAGLLWVELDCGQRNFKRINIVILIVFTGLLIAHLKTDFLNMVRLMPVNNDDERKYSAHGVLKEGQGKLLYSRWNLISRVDVIAGKHANVFSYLFGEDTQKIENDAFRREVELLSLLPISLYYNNELFSTVPDKNEIPSIFPPYPLMENPIVLIMGVGGGIDVARAKYHHAEKIIGVEINPDVVQLMRNELAEFSDDLYKNAQISVIDGRTFVQTSKEKYDIINLFFTDLYVPFNNSQVFIENYLYTIEAFKEYFERLTDRGVIFIAKWMGSDNLSKELLRLTTTSLTAMEELNVDNPENHLFIAGFETTEAEDKGGFICIKKKPFLREEIDILESFTKPPFYVNYSPFGGGGENIFTHFISSTNKGRFYEHYKYDVAPTTDNCPYFYLFNKKEPIKKGIHDALKMITILGVIPIFLCVFLKRERNNGKFYATILFFSSLALAFMFLEIFLVQRFSVYLGSPIYSFAVTLSSILIFAGMGSYLSRNFNQNALLAAIFSIPVLLGVYYFYLGDILNIFLYNAKLVRAIVVIVVLCPISLLIGVPFPNALRMVKNKFSDRHASFMYGVDGIFSLAAVIFSMVLSIAYGFNIILVISMAFYCLASVLFITFVHAK